MQMIDENKINKNEVEDVLGLSHVQEAMLIYSIKNPGASQFHECISIKLSYNIEIWAFEKAWKYVIDENEMLRTVFRWENVSKPVQIILKEHKPKIEYYNFYNENQRKDYKKLKEKLNNRRFDLRKIPFNIILCQLDESEYEMIITNHHLLYDGWSNNILLKEFVEKYNLIINNKPIKKKSKSKYKEFVKYNKNIDRNEEKIFWTKYLNSDSESNLLIKNFNELENKKSAGIFSYSLPINMEEKIRKFAIQEKLSLATVFYLAWGVLIQKYNISNDVVFGTTVSGRNINLERIESIIGLFINTVPLRIKTDKNDTINSLLQKTKQDLLNREKYEHSELGNINSYLGRERNEILFNTEVIVENYPISDELIKDNNYIEINDFKISNTNFDVSLFITFFDGMKLKLSYDKDKFQENIIERICVHYSSILDFIINNPKELISNIPMITQVEKNIILHEYNKQNDKFNNMTINQLFEEQVKLTPHAVALVFDDKEITYKELNEKANSLANILLKRRILNEEFIGIILEKSVEMIIATLAVLKAGGAYLPIDYKYPKNRIEEMLKDCNIRLLITNSQLSDFIMFECEKIHVDGVGLCDNSEVNPVNRSNANSLAYAIYTSGTTGKPKCILTEHRNVISYVNSFNKLFKLNFRDATLQQSSVTFDGFVEEVYSMLLIGGKVVIPKEKDLKDVVKLKDIVIDNNITILSCSPLILSQFNKLNKVSTVHTFLSSSDTLKKEYLSNIIQYSKVFNMYGPTETTVCATYYQCTNNESSNIPIGKPIPNYNVFIFDEGMNMQPIGVFGEIYIGGLGVSRGYLNNEKLTSEKFVKNPFDNRERLYKTGDLGRWLPNGNVELFGRKDNQVNLRGFRIELSEIEAILLENDKIDEVVVTLVNKDNIEYLFAYIVTNNEITLKEIRNYLADRLPEYMIPSQFIQLDKMPLTINGKIDKKSLLKNIKTVKLGVEFIAPKNETEKKLAELWGSILNKEKLGIYENFFQLGGNSLQLIQLYTRISEMYPGKATIADLFTYTNIYKLADFLDKGSNYFIEQSAKEVDVEDEINNIFDDFENKSISIDEAVEKLTQI